MPKDIASIKNPWLRRPAFVLFSCAAVPVFAFAALVYAWRYGEFWRDAKESYLGDWNHIKRAW